MPSHGAMVPNSIAVPPAASMPMCTCRESSFRFACPGVAVVWELTTAISGRESASSSKPIDLYSARLSAPFSP